MVMGDCYEFDRRVFMQRLCIILLKFIMLFSFLDFLSKINNLLDKESFDSKDVTTKTNDNIKQALNGMKAISG
jgi:hypothetical protein